MPAALEEQLYIPSGGKKLSGVLYTPEGAVRGSVLVCNPFFEERKSAQRAMVACARALSGDGYMVLRFDYRGCGDSEGRFEDYSADDWLADIGEAASCVNERAGAAAFGLLGLRGGANLALRAVEDGLGADLVMLWEPIPDGDDYIGHELRRKVLREMVTFGKGQGSRKSAEELLEAGEIVDLDGYELSPTLYRSIKEMSLRASLEAVSKPVCVAHVTHGDEPTPAMAPIKELLAKRDGQFELLKEEPFWNRIGLVKCSRLVEITQHWAGSSLSDE